VKPISASVSVDRPIQDVFAFLAEGRNNPIWRSDVTVAARILGTGADLGVGTTFMQRVTERSGRAVEETYEITGYHPPRLLEFRTTRGSTHADGSYTLVAINPVTTHVEFTLRPVVPRYQSRRRREYRDQLQDRVDFIVGLPTAMQDEGPPRL
jgi:hypothetical protein